LKLIEAWSAGADNSGVIMDRVKLSEMKTNEELIAEQLRTDPEFRAEWERTKLARAVAVAIVRYRAEHELSQRELAERLGMKQPQVARLELGEVNPSIETLMRLASELRIEFSIDVRPVAEPAGQRKAAHVLGASGTSAAELVVSAK
jgi:ribosome-binding protein aMBF1 (putative translation factor)